MPPFKKLLEHAFYTNNHGQIVLDDAERVCLWNTWMQTACGITEAQARGNTLEDLFPGKVATRLIKAVGNVLETAQREGLDTTFTPHPLPLKHPFGKDSWMYQRTRVAPITLDSGEKYCLINITDVTEEVEQENLTKKREKNLQYTTRAMGFASEGIAIMDRAGKIIYCNPALCEISDTPCDRILGKPLFQFLPGLKTKLKNFETLCLQVIKRPAWKGSFRVIGKDAVPYDVEVDLFALKNYRGEVEELVMLYRDVSELKKDMEDLQELARIDGLTRLYNRRYFMEVLGKEVKRARRHNSDLCIMIIDLDHFKNVNDNYGHLMGDQVLEHAAQTIKDLLRETDLVGRYGGEEICIALPETPISGGRILAERLRSRLAQNTYHATGKASFHVTCSIGLAEFRPEDLEVEDILKQADRALYLAKQKGRDQVRVAGEAGI